MMMMQACASALAGVLATAALPSDLTARGEFGPSSLTRLSPADVKMMFSKNLIIREGASDHLGLISDEFTSKGNYFQSGKRVPLMGSYVLRGELVCVDEGLQRAEKCRALYRSPDGALWETVTFGETMTVVALVRIQVERTPDTLKGM